MSGTNSAKMRAFEGSSWHPPISGSPKRRACIPPPCPWGYPLSCTSPRPPKGPTAHVAKPFRLGTKKCVLPDTSKTGMSHKAGYLGLDDLVARHGDEDGHYSFAVPL